MWQAMEGIVGIIGGLFVFGIIAQIATAKIQRKRKGRNISLPTVLVTGSPVSHVSSGVAAAAFNKEAFKKSEQPVEENGAILAASKGL
jgi:hypothetical protein